MEDRQESTAPQKEVCSRFKCRLCGVAPFFVGIVVALVFGWWLFPTLMFNSQEQPVQFTHDTHVNVAGLDCNYCHKIRPDGTFSAIPTTKECAVCHQVLLGESRAERVFWDEYIRPGKEVAWLIYQKQPDNVFFSHAPHSLENCNNCHEFSKTELCLFCHVNVKDKAPTYHENRLSGYSKDTMKMWQCERCHANPNHLAGTAANNACFVCHK